METEFVVAWVIRPMLKTIAIVVHMQLAMQNLIFKSCSIPFIFTLAAHLNYRCTGGGPLKQAHARPQNSQNQSIRSSIYVQTLARP